MNNVDELPWANREFVFVAGLHRSGTTLLAKILSSAPGAAGLDSSPARMGEGQFLQSVYPVDKELGGVPRWAFDPRGHLTEQDMDPAKQEHLWRAWSPYWGDEARVLVEKTPSNLTKTRYLQAAFPNSKFVVITRHPIPYAMAVRKWSTSVAGRMGIGMSKSVAHWLHAHELFREDSEHLERLHVIRYEDLLCETATVVEGLSDFLGVELRQEVLGEVRPQVLYDYAEDWRRLRGGRRQLMRERGWKKAVRRGVERVSVPIEARRIREYASQIESFGYDIDDLTTVLPWTSPSRGRTEHPD